MRKANGDRRPSGELEASVLAALWAANGQALAPADVQRELGTSLARTTVTTILTRLHEKGSVSRARSGRGYVYLPVDDSPGLAARRMRTELDKSAQDERGAVLARFVSALGPADERVLRALLAQVEGGASGGASEAEDGGPPRGDGFAGERGGRAHGRSSGERGRRAGVHGAGPGAGRGAGEPSPAGDRPSAAGDAG